MNAEHRISNTERPTGFPGTEPARRPGAAGLRVLLLLTLAAGCVTPTHPDAPGPGEKPPGREDLPALAKTPDIYTPPEKGRWTLALVQYIEEDPKPGGPEEQRLIAEETAKALRAKDYPAFILTRWMERTGSRAGRVPVYAVCVGAFEVIPQRSGRPTARERALAAEADTVRRHFAHLTVGVGEERRLLFQNATFILLATETEMASDRDLLALYEIPPNTRFALQVGLFQGNTLKKHAEPARALALKLRDQGFRPVIQQSEVASRVAIGPSARPDDPAFGRLRERFPRVEHNIVGYLSFRGVYQGATDRQRGAGVLNDLLVNGHDAFAERVTFVPKGSPPNATVQETRVYLVQSGRGTPTLQDLKRMYADIGPHGAEPVEYESTVIDLTAGAWQMHKSVPKITPGRGR